MRRHRVFAAALTATAIAILAIVPAIPASADSWSSWRHRAQHSFGAYVIRSNMWNCPCGPQKIWATSRHHFGAGSRQRGTAVRTYPSVQRVLTQPSGRPLPLRKVRALTSWYRERMPRHGIFEAAYDIWLNNYTTEVMVWVHNHRQVPAGHRVQVVRFHGVAWRLWADRADRVFTFNRLRASRHSRVHLRQMLAWLARHGYGRRHPGLSAVEFGWEICSTAGRMRWFEVTRYSVSLRRR